MPSISGTLGTRTKMSKIESLTELLDPTSVVAGLRAATVEVQSLGTAMTEIGANPGLLIAEAGARSFAASLVAARVEALNLNQALADTQLQSELVAEAQSNAVSPFSLEAITSIIQAGEAFHSLHLSATASGDSLAASGSKAKDASVIIRNVNKAALGLSSALRNLATMVIPAILIPIGTMIIDAINDREGQKSGADSRADWMDRYVWLDEKRIQAREGVREYSAELKALEEAAIKRVYEKKMSQADSDKKLAEDKAALETRYADAYHRAGLKDLAAQHMKNRNEILAGPGAPAAAAAGSAAPAAASASSVKDRQPDDVKAVLNAPLNTVRIDNEIVDLQEKVNTERDAGVKSALNIQLDHLKYRKTILLHAATTEADFDKRIDELNAQIAAESNAATKKNLEDKMRILREEADYQKTFNAKSKENNEIQIDAAKRNVDKAQKAVDKENEAQQRAMGIQANRDENAFAYKIKQLTYAVADAKEAKDEARAKQLQYELDVLNAQKRHASAMAAAARTRMKDVLQADAMVQEANDDYDSEIKLAQLDRDRKTKSQIGLGELMKRLTTRTPGGGFTSRGPVINSTATSAATSFGSSDFITGAASRSAFQSAGVQDMARAQISAQFRQKRQGNGKILVELVPMSFEIDNPLSGDVATIPGG